MTKIQPLTRKRTRKHHAPKPRYLPTQPCFRSLLREHIPLQVKALRGRECVGNCLEELDRVGGGQHSLYNGRRAYRVEFCK